MKFLKAAVNTAVNENIINTVFMIWQQHSWLWHTLFYHVENLQYSAAG